MVSGAPSLLAASVAVALLAVCGPVARADQASEYELKAAFIYHFARYTEWPEGPPNKGDAFVIAIFGDDPFGAALDDAVAGKSIGSRPIVVKRVANLEDLGAAHIVFVSASEDARLAQVQRSVAGQHVLLVGETARFAERGGAIGFRSEGAKVRFDINPQAVERAGLKMSSQLLKLARIVRDPGGR
jgi:hypothetical protein